MVRIGDDGAGQGKDLLHHGLCDDVFGAALAVHVSTAQRDDVIAVARRKVDVVQDHGNRALGLLVQPAHQFQKFDLMRQVKECGGFVQQQQLCVLRQGHGDPGALTLATRQGIERPVFHAVQSRRRKGSGHGGSVFDRMLAPGRLMRGATAQYQIADCQPLRSDR